MSTNPTARVAGAPPSDGDVAITSRGQTVSGWDRIKIQRGIEICPNSFELEITERYPGELNEVSLSAGDPCTVSIGGDTVITGFIDKYIPSVAAAAHAIKVVGRGKCQDLVDCSAIWPGGQISGANALVVAQKLASQYGITVKALTSVTGTQGSIPQFNLTLTDSTYAIIEEICRYCALLCYEDVDGSLILSTAGATQAASGFTLGEGGNVLAASVNYSADQRFSEIDVFLRSMETLGDLGNTGNLLDRETDTGVTRFRRKSIVGEAPVGGFNISKLRAQWEIARRIGRSVQVSVTADSWRDSAGTLWTPNTLAPLNLPQLKLPSVTWCLGDIVYLRDDQGTRCEIVLMDSRAYQPEPFLLVPLVPLYKPDPPNGQ